MALVAIDSLQCREFAIHVNSPSFSSAVSARAVLRMEPLTAA
jgi:hypothetical protein